MPDWSVDDVSSRGGGGGGNGKVDWTEVPIKPEDGATESSMMDKRSKTKCTEWF